MRKALALGIATVLGCSQRPAETCPSIERLVGRNAVADAHRALAVGDRHLLSLGGLAGEIPGVATDVAGAAQSASQIEGTSDTSKEACRRLRPVALVYATKYNQAIIGSSN